MGPIHCARSLMPETSIPDFTREDPWRIFRIMAEFVDSFESMNKIGPAVTVFGSARTRRNEPMYRKAVQTGRLLVESGFAVITGGGPGDHDPDSVSSDYRNI